MKVDSRDHAKPSTSTPTPGHFQQLLQRAGAPPSSRPPGPPRAPLPAPGQPAPRLPQPPRSAAPPSASASRPPIKASPPSTSTVRPAADAPPPSPGSHRLPGTALASGPILATSRSALASPESLGQARQAMHGEASRLQAVRTEAWLGAKEKTEHRLSELISRELARELRADPSPHLPARATPPTPEPAGEASAAERLGAVDETHPTTGGATATPADSPEPQPKVQATLQLIEKIELFVRSQRPAMRMSLGTPPSALVEVERTGPREVALRIQGRHGPVAQEDLSRIRDALEARGLRLSALSAE